MTIEQKVDAILVELAAIRAELAASQKQWDSPLVGDGKTHPKAPTAAEVAQNPAAYHGTPFDPLPKDLRISNATIIERFESLGSQDNPNRFIGGTIGEWYRRDPYAAMDYLSDSLHGNRLNVQALHPEQRKVLFGAY